jgi:hypothetical protein
MAGLSGMIAIVIEDKTREFFRTPTIKGLLYKT